MVFGLRSLTIRRGWQLLTKELLPNNSFKPKLLRSGNGVAEKACHAVTCATQFGLTQALVLNHADMVHF